MVPVPQGATPPCDLRLAVPDYGPDERTLRDIEVSEGPFVAGAVVRYGELEDLDVAVEERGHGGDCLAVAAYEPEHAVCRGSPGADGSVHLVGFDQVEEFEAMDHRDGLRTPLVGSTAPGLGGAGRLGVEAGQDVGMVLAGEGDDHVLA